MTYDDDGQGPALVFLHAFPFDRRMWASTKTAVGAGRRVVTMDFRGFGENAGAVAFSIADLADDVADLLTRLGIDRATLVGLSMGGYVALAFAALHPARLEGLVLCDTKAGPDDEEARKARDGAITKVIHEGPAAYVDGALPRLLGPRADADLRKHVRTLAEQSAEGVIAGLRALRDRPDRRSELDKISCRTLVLVGGDDQLTPPAEARAMASAIPGATLVEVSGAGHLANLEAPDAFNDALLAWLRG